eukprot:CAMPEP_0182450950 /NCGR_PEP_ID=MMETSP1172-20130603/43453_1 /TAXON_ID=708627 /ORGANISM="Timspurckia oligopyrenoides, Strain CCMP3278" /LENGTH=166 /DNA_ID=CAMNT_0024648677 /DNA_START=104 /DNA_END=604 /DNA_ORIENTATION=-
MVYSQLIRGEGWGKRSTRHKLLNFTRLDQVDAAYMSATMGKRVLEDPKFSHLETLRPVFVGNPFGVVFGNDPDRIMTVMKRFQRMYPSSLLLAAKFDDRVVSGDVFQQLMKGESYNDLYVNVAQLISQRPQFVDFLDQGSQGLKSSLDQTSNQLHSVLTQIEQTKD